MIDFLVGCLLLLAIGLIVLGLLISLPMAAVGLIILAIIICTDKDEDEPTRPAT